jgi:hypothetical protein
VDIKQFCGVDHSCRRPDGSKMSHDEMYGIIVDAIGLNVCVEYLPEVVEHDGKYYSRSSQQQIVDKKDFYAMMYKEDEHLNNITLKYWDIQHEPFRMNFRRIGINVVSISETVCTLKHAAMMWALERINAG